MSGPLGRFRGLFRRNNSPNLSAGLSAAITNFDKAANAMAKASGNQTKTARNLPAANLNSILGMKNSSGNTYALKLARSIMPLYRAAIGAVVKASVGAIPQTVAATKVANIASLITYKMTAANYLKLVNNTKRNMAKNRDNFGPNKSANAAAWWAAVNAELASRALLGGASKGPGPLPPSGLPANVVKSGNRYFKQNATRGGWVVVNANRNFAQSNTNKNVYNKPGGVVISGEGMV